MRWTELALMPTAFAIKAAVQRVISAGGSVCVSATTRSAICDPSGGMREGRVFERLQTAAITGLEGDGDSGSHAPDSHVSSPAGIPCGIQMLDLVH